MLLLQGEVNRKLIPISNWLAGCFGRLQNWAWDMRSRLTYCPTCGRNRYSGKPCFGKEEK